MTNLKCREMINALERFQLRHWDFVIDLWQRETLLDVTTSAMRRILNHGQHLDQV